MKRLFLPGLFILTFLSCLSQKEDSKKWRSGYIVLLDGDTLNGKIESENVQALSERLNFQDQSGTKKVYMPEEVRLFDAEGIGRHISGQLELEGESIASHVFFEVLVEGELSALKLNQEIMPRESFNVNYESEWYGLKRSNSTIIILDRVRFLSQIRDYLADCEGINEKISKERYKMNDRDMAQLAVDFNKCQASAYMSYYKAPVQDLDYAFFQFGGVGTSISPNNVNYEYADLNSKDNNGYFIQAGVGVPFNTWSSIEIGLEYRHLEENFETVTIASELYVNQGEKVSAQSAFKLNYSSLNVGLDLHYPIWNAFSISGSAGVLVGIGLNNSFNGEIAASKSRTDGLYLETIERTGLSGSLSSRELGTYYAGGIGYQYGQTRIKVLYKLISARNQFPEGKLRHISHKDALIGMQVELLLK